MKPSFAAHYTISPVNPNAHIFKVHVEINNPSANGQRFTLPAWIPGSYMIRDFTKNINELSALDANNKPVNITQLDKQTWQCDKCSTALRIDYTVYAWDLSVRTAHLDQTHGFFNGSSVFICLSDKENDPIKLTINPAKNIDDWMVATAYTPLKINNTGFGDYQAQNYDELIDHPVEMGNFGRIEFDVEGTPHEMIISGEKRYDAPRLAEDLTKICAQQVSLFNELPPMQRYLFLTYVVGNGYGGLEHRSSTALICSRTHLPLPGAEKMTDEYRTFLGLCSHEYFHTWNIKRIKPAAYLPYDLSQEAYTEQLWAFEGITSYYDDLALVRSGVISKEDYLVMVGQTITRVIRGSGKLKQSAAESSFNTWTKFYKQDESALNTSISYYTKGAVIALALDLTIRKQTQNKKSLDDVMQYLWLSFGKPGIGVPEGEIEKIASDIAGADLNEFFTHYLYQANDIDLTPLLDYVGVNYQLRPMLNADDIGGKSEPLAPDHPSLGAKVIADPLGAKITHVFENDSAETAGLAAGDIIIALNNLGVTKSTLETSYLTYKPGETVTVHAFRRDVLMEFKLVVQASPLNTCVLEWKDPVDSTIIQNRNLWLQVTESSDGN